MNSLQLGFCLKTRREQLNYTETLFAVMVNKVDSMKLEAGDNCSLNAFVHYLDAVYLGLFFMTESHDVGTITLNNSVATFYSTKLGKNLYSVEVYDTYGLLRYLNKVGIRMILKSSNATPYKKNSNSAKQNLVLRKRN